MNAIAERPLPSFVHGQDESLTTEGFRIDDERKAAWAAGKILSARKRVETREKLAQEYQTRILDWLSSANQTDQDSINFLEGSLRPWVEQEVSKLGKTRSFRLPGAKVGLRKKPDRVEIVNLETALEFCEEHLEEAVVVKKDISKSEIKHHLLCGARVPGVELIPGSDELSVSEG